MNGLETAIAASLRAEAEEAAMTTDTARESDKLNARLDAADRRRRRRGWAIGVAAAAAVVIAVVGAALLRSTVTASPPVVTGPSPTASPTPTTSSAPDPSQFVRDRSWSSTDFAVPMGLELPGWFQGANALMDSEAEGVADWIAVDCRTKCFGDQDAHLLLLRPLSLPPAAPGGSAVPITSVTQYVAHLRAQAAAGTISEPRTSSITVDGRPATAVRFDELTTADSVFGCLDTAGTDCVGSESGWRDRLAVLEVDGELLVVYLSALEIGNADAALATDFQELVSSIRLR